VAAEARQLTRVDGRKKIIEKCLALTHSGKLKWVLMANQLPMCATRTSMASTLGPYAIVINKQPYDEDNNHLPIPVFTIFIWIKKDQSTFPTIKRTDWWKGDNESLPPKVGSGFGLSKLMADKIADELALQDWWKKGDEGKENWWDEDDSRTGIEVSDVKIVDFFKVEQLRDLLEDVSSTLSITNQVDEIYNLCEDVASGEHMGRKEFLSQMQQSLDDPI
jgi:hypothetical protein